MERNRSDEVDGRLFYESANEFSYVKDAGLAGSVRLMNEMGLIFWLQVSTLNSRLKSINSNRTSFNHTVRSISASRSNKISNECPKMKRDERLKFCRNLFGFSISFLPGPGSRLSHQEHGIVCVACELRFIVMFEACGGDFGNKFS